MLSGPVSCGAAPGRPLIVFIVLAASIALPLASERALSEEAAEDEWPTYRGDVARTGVRGASSGGTGELLWSVDLSRYDNAESEPSVAGGVVYVGSDGGTLWALDAVTGSVNWNFTVGDGIKIRSSPTVALGKVYFSAENGQLYALEAATGALSWNYSFGRGARFYSGFYSSPAVADGTLYVGFDDRKVHAINAGSGAPLWQFETGDEIVSSPAVVGSAVSIGSRDGFLYSLDAATGEKLWAYGTEGIVTSSPAFSEGVLYIGADGVYALDASTGDEVWKVQEGVDCDTTPAVAGGVLYVACEGRLHAFDAHTGAEEWVFPGGVAEEDAKVYTSAAVESGIVYVGGRGSTGASTVIPDGAVFALEASTGELVWSSEFGLAIEKAPVVADGILYVPSVKWLQALDAGAGFPAVTPPGEPGAFVLSEFDVFGLEFPTGLSVSLGSKILAIVRVTNGGMASGSPTIQLLVDGQVGETHVVPLQGGETATVTFGEFTSSRKTEHVLEAAVAGGSKTGPVKVRVIDDQDLLAPKTPGLDVSGLLSALLLSVAILRAARRNR